MVWPHERLDMINLEVIMKYRNGKTDRISLTTRIDT